MTEPLLAQPAPMPFRILIDEAMRYTRRHFRSIFPGVAIPVALLSAASAAFQAFWFGNLLEGGADPSQLSPFGSIQVLLVAILAGFLMGFGYAALQVAALDATAGRPVDLRRAWLFPLRPPVLGTSILSVLIVIASMLACFFPVLYVAPLLSFALAVMVEEGRFGGPALSRSAELTRYSPRGQFLESALVKVLVLFVLYIVLAYSVAMAITIPFQMPLYISMFRSAAAGGEPALEGMAFFFWLQVPAQFLNALASMALYLYLSFAVALLFFDTRARKEGSDLAPAIDAVFAPPPPSLPLTSSPGEPQG